MYEECHLKCTSTWQLLWAVCTPGQFAWWQRAVWCSPEKGGGVGGIADKGSPNSAIAVQAGAQAT